MKKTLENVLIAISIISYFLILCFAYTKMDLERLLRDIEVFSGMLLVLGIITLEKAYKNESGKQAIMSIELFVLSFHSLSIMHFVTLFKCDFTKYLIISLGVIAIYYVLKSIIIFTKDRKEYLKGLSDIPEIVKNDEPQKKQAKKRKSKL